ALVGRYGGPSLVEQLLAAGARPSQEASAGGERRGEHGAFRLVTERPRSRPHRAVQQPDEIDVWRGSLDPPTERGGRRRVEDQPRAIGKRKRGDADAPQADEPRADPWDRPSVRIFGRVRRPLQGGGVEDRMPGSHRTLALEQ